MKRKKLYHYTLASLALLFTAASAGATTFASTIFWHEPKCPEELLK